MVTFMPAGINHLLVFVSITILSMGHLNAQDREPKSAIVISGLQMPVTANISANKEHILEGIERAAKDQASFLVTPEGSLSGYTSDFNQQELASALEEVRKAAKESNVGLLLGTCYKEKTGDKEYCWNQVRIYAPDGNFIGAHSKILRCSSLIFPGSGEMTDYVEGELKTFDWNGIRFGVLICNDLWATPGYTTISNPYLPWRLKQLGAQFIVHCINSGTALKYKPFHESSAELWAFSLHLPIIEVNAAQGDEKINARSGLIESSGERTVSIHDSGEQFFTIRVTPSAN